MLLLKTSFTKHRVCMLSIAAVLLLSCSSPTSTATPIPTVVPITPLPARPFPNWIWKAFPEPGVHVSLHEYNTHGEKSRMLQYSGGAVCLELSPSYLLEEGDYWKDEDLRQRTTITVDGKKVEEIVSWFSEKELHKMIREDNQGHVVTIASTVSQTTWCFAAPLSVGMHRVDVHFEKSNGERVSFAWTFELTSGP